LLALLKKLASLMLIFGKLLNWQTKAQSMLTSAGSHQAGHRARRKREVGWVTIDHSFQEI
jgi:hypothetical protein